ncbi:hypothetical protein B0T26DRAFT_232676 [Lasiosphaeria miniovina]|uniref:Uncharacterized protein n=1 Tax=Lasiosphaeria miniovina TaxID=1954250 RepID=A0AA40AVK5_9PEZI|nr:uncharacterized protein B0T26DRAFT_232676 [Lasiosphaeria miniovina]KAK0722771.1 hypothetical protein B0T26DRAFT_232676 [Lasiosphaeria miniovina]
MHFAPLQISHLQRPHILPLSLGSSSYNHTAYYLPVSKSRTPSPLPQLCVRRIQYIVPKPSASRRTLALTAAESRVAQPRTHLVPRGDDTTLMHSCATRYHNRAQSISLPRPQAPRRRILTRRIFAQSALIDIVPSSTIQ